MEQVNDFIGRFDETVVLCVACFIGAAFVFILIFDSFRRRRKQSGRRNHPPRPNIFKRSAANFHALREELKRRNARKGRRNRDNK